MASHVMMRREARVAAGVVPHSLHGEPLTERTWQLAGDTFLMRGDGEHYLCYRRGEGVTVERGPGADLGYEALWLSGSVHAAIACLNGLIPIHASAVAHRGRAYAFTGPSGAGKSTLIAALGRLGLPMVCDDTLVLDPAHDEVMCLPGHKRLKLTPAAAAMTGAEAQDRVVPVFDRALDKVYALPPAGDVGEPLPLAQLVVIEYGETLSITPIVGGNKVGALLVDHYTIDLLGAAGQDGARTLFERIGALAARTAMARLTRRRDVSQLHDGAARVAEWIRRQDEP